MKQYLIGATLVLLTACGGGGGGGSNPLPNPGPTVHPPTGYTVQFRANGGVSTQGVRRTAQARTMGTVTTNPLIPRLVQTFGDFNYSQQVALDVVPTPSASPIPESQPAVSVTNGLTNDAHAVPNGPSTDTIETSWLVGLNTTAVGSGTFTATFPDGSVGSIPAENYYGYAVNCTAAKGNGLAFSAAGIPTKTSTIAGSDVYADGPASAGCGGAWDNEAESATTLHFPGGYQIVAAASLDPAGNPLPALANITSIGSFTSQGTSLAIPNQGVSSSTIGESLIISTANGYVKYMPLLPWGACDLYGAGAGPVCNPTALGMGGAMWAATSGAFSQ